MTLRWQSPSSVMVENQSVDNFIKDIIDVCKRHGFSISHEDSQGAFEIVKFNEVDVDWFQSAIDNTLI